jgi:hypothetical protein
MTRKSNSAWKQNARVYAKLPDLDPPKHFHRPVERAFTAEQRAHTTILFGGFTWKHEDLIRAVFQSCGYRCEKLPDWKGIWEQWPLQPNIFHGWQSGAVSPVPGKGRFDPPGDSRQTTSFSRPDVAVPAALACMKVEYRFAAQECRFSGRGTPLLGNLTGNLVRPAARISPDLLGSEMR